MKFVTLASLLVLGALSFVLAGTPTNSEADSHGSKCETCGPASKTECRHCATGETCPRCDGGGACADCGHPGRGKSGKEKWEYKCVRPSKKADSMTAQFNGLGAEGWRLKEADSGFWCFAKIKAD